MNATLLAVAIVIFTVQTICFKLFSRRFMKSAAVYFAFNALYFALIVVILSAFGIRLGGLHAQTLVLSAVFGLVFVATIFLYMKAMENGPLSLSSLVFSFGLLVPIVFGALFWGEPVSLLRICALVLLFFTFWLGGRSPQAQEKKVNVPWLAFSAAAMLGNGALMTLSKAHQMLLPGREIVEFLVVAFGTASLSSFALFLVRRFVAREKAEKVSFLPFALLVLATGVATAFGNQITLMLSGRIPAVVQFPVTNGGIVLLSSVLSVFIFRERMTKSAWVGLGLGFAAMALLCLNFP